MIELTKNSKTILQKIKDQYLIDKSIRREFRLYIWFDPKSAKFIYDDMFFEFEDIEPLILNNLIILKGFELHQGEKMLKYILNKK